MEQNTEKKKLLRWQNYKISWKLWISTKTDQSCGHRNEEERRQKENPERFWGTSERCRISEQIESNGKFW